MTELYDSIGIGYRRYRQPDPRIEALIQQALGNAASVVNVGAGAGSYEPRDRDTVAVEPSDVMIEQRSAELNPVLRAYAEALPFADNSFDIALAILTVHHWPDRPGGLAELQRVARDRAVVLTHDGFYDSFWLMEYFPEIIALDDRIMPPDSEFEAVFSRVSEIRIPIPWDCSDGFLAAYWRRPEMYLEQGVRDAISAFAMIERVDEGLERLRADLQSGVWQERFGKLMELDSLDLGYKLVVGEC